MSEMNEIKISEVEKNLENILYILKKEEVKWPYKKLSLNEFNRKFFPHIVDKEELKKFHSLQPQQLITVVDNKLRTINSILRPLEENLNALKFQYQLFKLFSIFDKKECIKILNKTPRGIRDGFTTEKALELASLNNINQKQVAEIMNLWLNMRYYGALSCSLSPRFMLPVLEEDQLKEKISSIKKRIDKLEPDLESRHKSYNEWVFSKQKLDEERKLMSFGPESVQVIEDSLNLIYNMANNGEIEKEGTLKIVNLIEKIIDISDIEAQKEKKTLIPKEKKENIINLKEKIKNKPKEFFYSAQIVNKLLKNEILSSDQLSFLKTIIEQIEALPKNIDELLENSNLIIYLNNIFEPLANIDLEKSSIKEELSKKKKEKLKETKKIENEDIKLINKLLNISSKWILKKIIEEKENLEKILEIFSGIPLVLVGKIAELINKNEFELDIEKFKSRLISYLAYSGIYELYNHLEVKKEIKEEIEVSDEILIPPRADQRLAPIQKQIKFEFMRFIETAEFKNIPLFDFLEGNKIPPILIVDAFIESTEKILIEIINLNSEKTLHKLVNLDKNEYEVKIKTIKLKLQPLIKQCQEVLIKTLNKYSKVKKIKSKPLIKEYKEKIREIWIENLIETKKIEIKSEEKIGTGKVSEIAAKLMQKKAAVSRTIPPKAPPSVPPKAPPSVPPKAPPSVPPKAPPSVPPKAPPSVPPKAPPSVPPKAPPNVPPKAPPNVPPKAPTSVPPKTSIKSNSAHQNQIDTSSIKVSNEVLPEKTLKTISKSSKEGEQIQIKPYNKKPEQIQIKSNIIHSTNIDTKNNQLKNESKSTELIDMNEIEGPVLVDIESPISKSGSIQEKNNNKLTDIKKETEIKIPTVFGTEGTGIKGTGIPANKGIEGTGILGKPFNSQIGNKNLYMKQQTTSEEIEEISDFSLNGYTSDVQEEELIKKKSEELKAAIDDAMDSIQEYMAGIDKISPQVLKSALKLIYEIKKTDIKDLKPKDARKIINLAEELKAQKEMIENQTKKLKTLEIKLTEKALDALEAKLKLVTIRFDEFIEVLHKKIRSLSNRGELILEELSKKFSKETRVRRKIFKGSKKLTEHVDIIKRITDLPSDKFEKAKNLYERLKKVREKRHNIEVHNISKELALLLGVDFEDLQKATRDKILRNSMEEVFSRIL
ncbi:MAG: hypothetical protein ACTSPY_10985 [Candidatus Helarchaeota archaeon]